MDKNTVENTFDEKYCHCKTMTTKFEQRFPLLYISCKYYNSDYLTFVRKKLNWNMKRI